MASNLRSVGAANHMSESHDPAELHLVLQGTAVHTGIEFHRALVENLAKALSTHGAWVTEYIPERGSLRALAFYLNGEWIEDWEEAIEGTPCEVVIREERLVHHPERIVDLFPEDGGLREMGAVSYLGVPLKDLSGEILGHLAVLDTRPMAEDPRTMTLFKIFAARAAAELMRMRREAALREREERMTRLIEGAMDAILELDEDCRITRVNSSTMRIFGCRSQDVTGWHVGELLAPLSKENFDDLLQELRRKPQDERSIWLTSGLEGRTLSGEHFPIEGTFSSCSMDGEIFYTLILRNLADRLEAERKIEALSSETHYLRHELDSARGFGEILGESEALSRVLRDVAQVAETDASVLILGETGTGKELIARAIHARSRRKARPLVRLNCGAIPTELIESELFGHEEGAFTGATRERRGRFELADGGTMFLDEIGELSAELQVKLLRVLQEGEFEPVGSSETRKVDVRVLSATNRDLKQMVAHGEFREDLYYRLEVFPILVPPLRERGDDVVLIAEAIAKKCARELGRELAPLSADCARRLCEYSWPGNIRELQNVIERAAITSQENRLNLDRALPDVPSRPPGDFPVRRILSASELAEFEKENLLRALDASDWQIAGSGGAAERLGLKPTTLKSRVKALGLSRPAG